MNAFFRILAFVVIGSSSGHAQNIAKEQKNLTPGIALPSIGKQISQHIEILAGEERDKRMDFMQIVIDDISRLCELDEVQKEKLTLAAKGSTERSMKRWHEQAERYFRSRVNGADADTAKEILSNIGTVNFGSRGSDREGENQSLWKDSLKNVLSEPQVKKYEEVVEQRKQSEIDAFSHMAVVSLDIFLRLTPIQKSKISPIVKESAKDNLDEVRRYWGDYLEKNMLMSLVNVADKTTLTGILTDNQYERLQSATSNLEHFWENRRRLKKAKDTAEEKKKGKDQEIKKKANESGQIKIGGKVTGGRIRIKAGGNGAVIIKPGAVFRGGDIQIEGGNIKIED